MSSSRSLEIRRAAQAALRRLHLLSLADAVRFGAEVTRNWRENREWREGHLDFPLPPAWVVYDSHGKVKWQKYYDSGIEVSTYLAERIDKHLGARPERLLEWGCGPGRVIRHLPGLLGPDSEIYGTDYNHRSIAWCSTHLPAISFRANGLRPPLPFRDAMFDCVIGLSVFTHLSRELHEEWSKELTRITRKGGLILLTLNGEYYRSRALLPHEQVKYDAGELVVRASIDEGKKFFAAYHPDQYVIEQLLDGWDVVEHDVDHERSTMKQDVWMARKL